MRGLSLLILGSFLTFAPNRSGAEETHAYPNPYIAKEATSKEINFTPLPVSGTLKIYTVDGTEVQSLSFGPGDNPLKWNVKNASGKDVASGVYFFRVSGDGEDTIGKLVVIR